MIKKALKAGILGSLILTSCLATVFGQSRTLIFNFEQAFYSRDFEAVVNYYESLSYPDSLSANAYYLTARSYNQLLKSEKAIKLLKKARHLKPHSTKIRQALALAYKRSGRFKKAKKVYKQILQRDTANFIIRLALAELYYDMNEWQSAIKEYQKLLSNRSKSSLLYARLAYCYAALGKVKKARVHFKYSHHFNPHNANVTLQLSGLYFKKEQWAKALQVVNETLTFHSNNTILLKRRADINFERDSIQAAVRDYKKILSLGDTTVATLRKLGIARVMLKKYRPALANLKNAYRRNPMHAATSFYLGIAYRETNRLNMAQRFLNRTVDIIANGLLVNTLKQLAQTYHATRNLPKALDAYKLALDLKPSLSGIYFRLAVLYDKYYKDKSVALLYYRKYLRESKNGKHSQKMRLRQYANSRVQALYRWKHFH